MVPEGENAAGAGALNVATCPEFLLGARVRINVAVERQPVPSADVEAVVALAGGTGAPFPIGEVRRGGGAAVFVIARNRPRAGLVTTPRRVVTVPELGIASAPVSEIARGKDGSRQPVKKSGGRFGTLRSAFGDIARGKQDGGVIGSKPRIWQQANGQ